MINKKEKARELVSNWSKTKINETKIENLFNIEGNDLYWMLKGKLLFVGFKFKFWNINKSLDDWEKKKYPHLKKLKKYFYFKFIKYFIKAVLLMRTSKKSSINKKIINKKIIILTYADQISILEKKLKVYRFDSILDIPKIKKDICIASIQPLTYLKNIKKTKEMIRIEDYFDKQIIKKSKKEANRLNKIWKNISKSKLKSSLSINNDSFYPYFDLEYDFLFSKEWLQLIFLYYYTYKKIIKTNDAKIILTTVGLLDEPMHLAAKNMKIPSIMLQHGFLDEYAKFIDLLDSQYYFSYGKLYKSMILKKFQKRVFITGANIFDRTIDFKNKNKPNKKHILLLTQNLIESNVLDKKKYFSYIKKIISKLNKFNLPIVIKLHPAEKNLDEYTNITKNNKNIKIVKKDNFHKNENALYTLINDSIFTISFGSTTILDSIILEKPVLQVILPEYNVTELNHIKNIIKISVHDDFKESIKLLIDEKKSKQITKNNLKDIIKLIYKLDKKSSDRIIRNTLKILKK